MAATPTPAAETVPGYVRDSATGQWYQIGVGAHTHSEYVPNIGGVDVGPGTLSVVTPVDANDVARYADGIPRFPTTAARDAFYTALPGGAQEGMQCYVSAKSQGQQYLSGLWLPVTGSLPRVDLVYGDFSVPVGWNSYGNAVVTNTDTDSYSVTGSTITTLIPGTFTISYSVNISGFDMVRLIPAVGINGDYGSMHMWGSTVAGPTFVNQLLMHGYLDAALPANTTLALYAFTDPAANVSGAGTRLVAEYRHP